jgi:O-antigen/teichoic acid export membrane protein
MIAETQVPRAAARSQSVLWVLVATGITGISGFVVMLRAAAVLGAESYAYFGVFWSGLFLVVGVLFGLQQEATRATAESLNTADTTGLTAPPRSSLWIFGAAAGLIAGLLVYVTSFWWAPATLGSTYAGLSTLIALGSALNAVVATISGALAGAARWRLVAVLIALDGLLRLGGVLIVLAVGADPTALAWAVIIPFPLSLAIVFCCAPRTLVRLSRSPLPYRKLAANSGHTLLAASATAVLINGFPLILAFFAQADETATLGALILAITLTRAPILVPMMALQAYLVTRFTSHPAQVGRLVVQAIAVIVGAMAVIALVTALWGTWALRTFVRPDFALSTEALVPLVVSSGFIGALCVTGPALLARGRHRAYALGWLVASIVALAVLFIPVQIEARAALALSIGPIAGLLVHFVALRSAPQPAGSQSAATTA